MGVGYAYEVLHGRQGMGSRRRGCERNSYLWNKSQKKRINMFNFSSSSFCTLIPILNEFDVCVSIVGGFLSFYVHLILICA